MSDRRSIVITWEDPAPFREEIAALSGLEYLAALGEGRIPLPPIGGLIDFRLAEAGFGRVAFEFTPAEYHCNPFGSVHGGVPSVLIDSAAACAVHSTLAAGVRYTTLEIKVNFVRPITTGSGRMTCEGKVVHAGGRIATAEARITDNEGRLYAHGVSTCMIL